MKVVFRFWFCLVCVLLSLLSIQPATGAGVPDPDALPPDLLPWQSWVLHGKEKQFCPLPYSGDGEAFCAYPSRLVLVLEGKSGSFTQDWLVFSREWVPLPGGAEIWPRAVVADGNAVPVVNRGGTPCIRLKPGRHRVSGAFVWTELPEMMQVPAQSGLLDLTVDGRKIESAHMDGGGRLWVQSRKAAEGEENRVDVRVFRLLNDEIPMRVTTLLKINVSGQPRELRFSGVVPQGAAPMSIRGVLPAKLGAEGELMVQARPGRFEIEMDSRLPRPVEKLGPVPGTYGREIWAFQPQNHLRMVEISGVPSIDPTQTDTPQTWKKLSTYVVEPGAEVSFKAIRRGDPEPAPDQLHLERTWWLDFDGKGFTVHDRVHGTMSRQWYLTMNPPLALGRVSVDGADSLITSQGKESKPGVELRRGQLNMTADARLDSPARVLPAVAWDHDFQSVSGVLNLPPGWKLLAAGGVDVLPDTWFEKWTLLDIFLVLIIASAVTQLWTWRIGLLALVAVGLSYHEPGAPQLVWLHLLAATALLKFLPEGKLRKPVRLWWLASVGALLIFTIPFAVQQARWGIYPQLETRGVGTGYFMLGAAGRPSPAQTAAPVPQMQRDEANISRSMPYTAKKAVPEELKSMENRNRQAQDPKARIQTGPGLPDWQWRSVSMKWNGPVDRTQKIDLWLISPAVNLVLGFLRILLLALFIYFLLARDMPKVPEKLPSFCLLLLGGLLAAFPAQASTSGYPSPELLKQLEERLLEKPDCLPYCAESARIEVVAGRDTLRILAEWNAAVQTVVPIAGNANSWLPEQVLLDDLPAEGLRRASDGSLWMVLPEGIHRVTEIGRLPAGGSVQVSLGLKPHFGSFRSDADWEVQGIGADGRVEPSIQLTKRSGSGTAAGSMVENAIEPFLHVERVLELGLDSRVKTTVRRITPPGTPVMVSIPLLEGESILTPGIQASGGQAMVHLGAGDTTVAWEASIDIKEGSTLKLVAPDTASWTETWILDASPIWHCDISGIPVIHHKDQEGYWRPQWRPWPGERVGITVTKPVGIPGQSVTIDRVKLQWTPGERFNKAELSMQVRSSQGGQHKITLPEGADLDVVRVMGKAEPIPASSGDKREITVPLQPGTQEIAVEWRQGTSSTLMLKGPPVEIGQGAVNASVTFNMPRRWVLWAGGPQLGPAVLFWSYLLVVMLGAFALARIPWLPQSPLKTVDWFLLGLGLTQVDPIVALMIVGWLLALGWRGNRPTPRGWFSFDMMQLSLVLLTVAALAGLYYAVHEGLLGIPRMQISGNGSTGFRLNWTQDRIGSAMPQPWVVSLPMYVYRVFMLLWALWLAQALLKWLRWGWQSMNEGGFWRRRPPRKARAEEPAKSE